MKLLITGSRGQLGNELISIIKSGYAEIGAIPEGFDIADVTAIDIDELDISDLDAVRKYITSLSPDAVVNCAAFTNVNACETEQELAYKANAVGPSNLAAVCEEIGAKVLHVSTDYVFSGDGNRPYVEQDPTDPCGAYGKTKEQGEKFALANCKKTFIFRVAWLYGYVGKNFVKTIITAGRNNGALKVVNDQFGNPTSANDVAYHILKVLKTENYGIYHCTNNGICSWYDFAARIIEKAGVNATVAPCTTDEYPTPAKRPAYSALDNAKLRATVGDEMRNWQDAIDMYVENLMKSGF